jgi:hypothetical protein
VRSVYGAGLEVEEHRAGHLLTARGLVINRVYATELLVIVAAVLAVAAGAVLAREAAWRWGALGIQRAGRCGETRVCPERKMK